VRLDDMNQSRSRELLARSIKVTCCALAIVVHLSGRGIAASQPEPRELPDYDGRGGPPKPAGKALLWVPRVVLSPLYLTSEYLVRRPLGWLITSAERAQVPAALYDFFAFGPDHKAGFVPIAFIEFGFRPSFGLYAFWDDAGWKGHDLRLHVSTGGNNWFAGSFTERFRLAERNHLTLNASAARRPDYAFFGVGPLTANDDRVRYGADTFDARAVVDVGFWRSSKIEATVGFRSAAFFRGYYLGQPTIEDRVASGTLPLPEGYIEGYEAGFTRAKIALDTRRHDSISGSGGRLELEGEQGTDLKQAAPSGWIRYGGAVGGFLDLGDNGRVVSLSVSSIFADPVGPRPVPFTELATLGGAGLMPGFRSGRLRDRSAAVATLRYSWPIWMWLKGSIQTAAGNVFGEHLHDFRPGLLRMSAAIGVESEGSPDSTLQILFGVGTETFDQGARIDSLRLTLGARNGF
jgi:hypothetical protein